MQTSSSFKIFDGVGEGVGSGATTSTIGKKNYGNYECSVLLTWFSLIVLILTYQLFVHVCLYACVCVCMYACLNICMDVCMYVCMSEYLYVCMYACLNICMYVCMYVCMYACVYVCKHVYVFI